MIHVSRIGFVARRAVGTGAVGRVVARFDRSAYLDIDGRLVCLAAPGLDDGPLVAFCDGIEGVRLGERRAVRADAAAVWRPPVPYGWTADSLNCGLDTLDRIIGGLYPADGLGVFGCEINPGRVENRETRAAHGPIAAMCVWLDAQIAGFAEPVPRAVGGLVGLGPGLTPSGDDFLGGAMVTAHAAGRPDIAARLFDSVSPGDTGPVSAAHLDAAREGAAGAPLHDLLNDVLCGCVENIPGRLTALNRMGHSSGWDAFAGCVSVLRAMRRDFEKRAAA